MPPLSWVSAQPSIAALGGYIVRRAMQAKHYHTNRIWLKECEPSWLLKIEVHAGSQHDVGLTVFGLDEALQRMIDLAAHAHGFGEA